MQHDGRRLPRSFFDRDVDAVADDLLGRVIAVVRDGIRVAVRLTEVEAYAGLDDPASHAFRGLTPRTAIMFGPPGHLYTYFVYGMHWCANIVTGPDGDPSAVLLRAGQVVDGVDTARAAPTAGDARTTNWPAVRPAWRRSSASTRRPTAPICAAPMGRFRCSRGEGRPQVRSASDHESASRPQPRSNDASGSTVTRASRHSGRGRPASARPDRPTCCGKPSSTRRRRRGPSRVRWQDDGVPNSDVAVPEDDDPAVFTEPGATPDPLPPLLVDLNERGLISQSTGLPALAADVAAGPLTAYVGFDPTAPSLHIGNLVQLLTMRRIQQAGHRPLMLVGGATGLIGDPRMSGERVLNSPEIVAGWVERIRGSGRALRRLRRAVRRPDGQQPRLDLGTVHHRISCAMSASTSGWAACWRRKPCPRG